MSSVARFNGFRVAILIRNEHGPAHVHVYKGKGKGEKEVAFWLNCPDGPVRLKENFGFNLTEVNEIEDEVAKRLRSLCRKWKRIHGNL